MVSTRVAKTLGLCFFLWHSAAIVYTNLPVRLFFPDNKALASDATFLKDPERALFRLREALPGAPFEFYRRWTRLQQGWSLFAPVPPVLVTYTSVTDEHGRVLYTNLPAQPYGTYSTWHNMRFLLREVMEPRNVGLQQAFAAYYARKNRTAQAIVITEHLADIPAPGPVAEPPQLWNRLVLNLPVNP